MKWLRGLLVGVAVSLGLTVPATALEATPSPDVYRSPVFVTALQMADDSFGNNTIDAVELYNESDAPISLRGWRVEGMSGGVTVCQLELASRDLYLLPSHYTVAADGAVLQGEHILMYDQPCGQNGAIDAVRLHAPDRTAETINGVGPGAWVRKGVSSTYRDEDDTFRDNFAPLATRSPATLYADPLYEPPESTPLKIVEILPRAKDCSPLETNNTGCYDYVKLFNPMNESWPLDNLRLRIGHQAQNVTSSNGVRLGGSLAAGSYGVIRAQADNDPLSVIDGGGWAWLEDAYGLHRYDATVVRYGSADTSQIGMAWAFDESDGSWKWTSTPTPYNQPNSITVRSDNDKADGENALTPCRSDQYRNPLTNHCKLKEVASTNRVPCAANQFRNPLTNRCKLKSSATSGSTPCDPGQFRNPATNRCKSAASSTTSLKPCQANQFRNPATNRCKLIASSDGLKPCEEGWQRNPLTNRCRKVSSGVLASTGYPVKPYNDSAEQSGSWAAFALVSTAAVGYGVWEWRREIGGIFAKVRTLVGK